jgi:hypothetical protein
VFDVLGLGVIAANVDRETVNETDLEALRDIMKLLRPDVYAILKPRSTSSSTLWQFKIYFAPNDLY